METKEVQKKLKELHTWSSIDKGLGCVVSVLFVVSVAISVWEYVCMQEVWMDIATRFVILLLLLSVIAAFFLHMRVRRKEKFIERLKKTVGEE